MNRSIDVSKRARADIFITLLYLIAQSKLAHDNFAIELDACFSMLARRPAVGRVVKPSRGRTPPLRRWRVSLRFRNYLVFYRATPNRLRVVRVMHGARDLTAILGLPE